MKDWPQRHRGTEETGKREKNTIAKANQKQDLTQRTQRTQSAPAFAPASRPAVARHRERDFGGQAEALRKSVKGKTKPNAISNLQARADLKIGPYNNLNKADKLWPGRGRRWIPMNL